MGKFGKKARKHSDSQKHRDKQPMKRYACNGCIKITIYGDLTLSNIKINHLLHPIRPNVSISTEIKQFILENVNLLSREIYKRLIEQGLDINVRQKHVHFWWTELRKNQYRRDKNPFLSAKKWLEEKLYKIIFQKEEKALGFLTKFWDILKNSQFKISEIGVDATYNTNNLKFELYVVHTKINRMGFPLAYLFLENGNCGGGIRTGIIIDFFLQLKIRGFEPEFFLTDKDFSQISAARFVWKNVKIQLYLWHIKKAVETRLGNNKNSQQINYNEAVQEIYNFCQQNSLPRLWVYLWNEWYGAERWFLWLRAGCSNKLSILKTNMFVEAHWKVLKRDFLYKFFRPRLDLVVFIIMEQVCGCPAFLTSRFFICKHLVQQKGTVNSQFFDNVHRHHQYPFLDTSLSQNYNLAQLTLQVVTNIEVNENENTQIV
ncbi:unnamed protein product [Rhizophagus irregularis]|nr:unnamed protein product [Rhizophagus irregularis]